MHDHSKQGDQPPTGTQSAKAKKTAQATDQGVDQDQAVDSFEVKVETLEAQLKSSQESHLRTQADYQNLQRRSREERQHWVKLATKDFATSLLEPLDHLSLAAKQLNDQGLNMTISQLWERLREQGLEELDPLGQEFDVNTMEAVDRQGDGEVVLSVVKKGYLLNGEVIQHAKVIVGNPKLNN